MSVLDYTDGLYLATVQLYSELSQMLICSEHDLLLTLGFQLTIEHPHAYVILICKSLKANRELMRRALLLATTTLHMTTFCIEYKPRLVACVCVHLAFKWSGYAIQRVSAQTEWFCSVDRTVTLELLEKLSNDFIAILQLSPQRFPQEFWGNIGEISKECAAKGNAMNEEQKEPSSESAGRGREPQKRNVRSEMREQHKLKLERESQEQHKGELSIYKPARDGNEPELPATAFMSDFRKEMAGKEPESGDADKDKLGAERGIVMNDENKQPCVEQELEAKLHSMEEYRRTDSSIYPKTRKSVCETLQTLHRNPETVSSSKGGGGKMKAKLTQIHQPSAKNTGKGIPNISLELPQATETGVLADRLNGNAFDQNAFAPAIDHSNKPLGRDTTDNLTQPDDSTLVRIKREWVPSLMNSRLWDRFLK